ncbi:toll/interleukin-1 receptor domain-containing protein [Rheinheimera sp.]|uniref:toll/interleukin-1 receptor domain-containing protein n=1 Tax=Rheinheimera sp. TaxID=1869214 RepID=UPI002FDE9093
MGQSVLVFVSHSSEDKESLIEPIVRDLEDCYINVWLDKRKILPGDNLRKSIFRDGLDKADVALIFFTQQSLKSSWVDREIKHVLREESKKGNDFDLNKIISIFDSQETYEQISERYPELTDDLLHLMPEAYNKVQLGQLISAIWSKYLSLQGGDIESQRQLLARDKELFQKDKDISALKSELSKVKNSDPKSSRDDMFKKYAASGKLGEFIQNQRKILTESSYHPDEIPGSDVAKAFGLVDQMGAHVKVSQKGREFFEWLLLDKNNQP